MCATEGTMLVGSPTMHASGRMPASRRSAIRWRTPKQPTSSSKLSARWIANGALRVDEAGLLGAGRAETNELHWESLLGACGRLAVCGRRRAYPVALVPLQVKGA